MSWFEIVNSEAAGESISSALEAVPKTIAAHACFCRVTLAASLPDELSSRWKRSAAGLEIELAATADPHDLALELLFCLGQAVWEKLSEAETADWLRLLDAEIRAGVEGEIDEDSLAEKRRLLSSRVLARSPRRLERYASVSFAATLAEYVHALWHDVTVRTGPEHLPALYLRRRLELLERWFPPGGKLFG